MSAGYAGSSTRQRSGCRSAAGRVLGLLVSASHSGAGCNDIWHRNDGCQRAGPGPRDPKPCERLQFLM